MQSLGLIETKGMLAAIEAADAMLKAADVGILGKIKVGGGRMNVSVTGDVAAVKAAVDAGMAAVDRLGSGLLLSGHVIARPHEELETVIGGTPPMGPDDGGAWAERTRICPDRGSGRRGGRGSVRRSGGRNGGGSAVSQPRAVSQPGSLCRAPGPPDP